MPKHLRKDGATPKTTTPVAKSGSAVSLARTERRWEAKPTSGLPDGEAGIVAESVLDGEAVPDGEATPDGDEEEKRPSALTLIKETGIIVISALIVSWLIKTFLVQAFFIPSESMEDTFERGDRVMVSRLVPRFFDVHRGDIVVFKDPGDWLSAYSPPDRGPFTNALITIFTGVGLLPQDSGEHLVKRTIGVPGDNVVCCTVDGLVTVNGTPIEEWSYIRPGSIPSQVSFDVTVPDDMLFVMGDNRQNSADSRFNADKPFDGFVPIENVVGTAFATVWPLGRATILHNPGSVFATVPNN